MIESLINYFMAGAHSPIVVVLVVALAASMTALIAVWKQLLRVGDRFHADHNKMLDVQRETNEATRDLIKAANDATLLNERMIERIRIRAD